MGAALPVSFERKCATLGDLAQRYRVLAALHEGGVTFTLSNEELRAAARALEVLAARPSVIVIEREAPMGAAMQLLMAFLLTLSIIGILGDAAVALLRWFT